jgi:GH15 family glucan-1,4-alpha-glucosidase
MTRVAAKFRPGLEAEFGEAAQKIHSSILANAWNEWMETLVSDYGGKDLDASLLQAVCLRFLPKNDIRLRKTVDAIWQGLTHGGWLLRYRADDGFGTPTVAFTICTFWLVEALAETKRKEEARALLEQSLSALSPLGLLSEDYDVTGRRMWGNFPQAYSHVGLIHAAFAASPKWLEIM